MNPHPVELIMPLFDWLDAIIRDHGDYIYIGMVWLAPFLIAWIAGRGSIRKRARQPQVAVIFVPPIPARAIPPPLPDDEGSSFAA